MLPPPSQAPPRNTLAFRPSPDSATSADFFSRRYTRVDHRARLASSFSAVALGTPREMLSNSAKSTLPSFTRAALMSFRRMKCRVGLTNSPLIHRKVEFRHSYARRLDRKELSPFLLKMFVTLVKFFRKDEILLCVVNTKSRNGITAHILNRRFHANIGPIKMEMRQTFIEPEPGGFSQDQYDFIQKSCKWCGTIERFTQNVQTAGSNINPSSAIVSVSP